MLAIRLLGRVPVLATPSKRVTCLRFLTGIASGGGALAVAWKHYRLHAAAPLKLDTRQVQPISEKIVQNKVLSAGETFDWKLFWYYLRPQIWIIACATAVGRLLDPGENKRLKVSLSL